MLIATHTRPSDLGDIICIEGDCEAGEIAVAQMRSVYDTLKAQGVNLAAFESSYRALLASYREKQDSWSRRIPFTPVCCSIREIGRQGAALTTQMQAAAGVKALPGLPIPTGVLPDAQDAVAGLGTALKIALGVVAGAAVIGLGVYAVRSGAAGRAVSSVRGRFARPARA